MQGRGWQSRGKGLTLPVVETDARQDRSGCHNRSSAPSFGPGAHSGCKLRAVPTGGHSACLWHPDFIKCKAKEGNPCNIDPNVNVLVCLFVRLL